MEKVLFTEEQRFVQWRLWLIASVALAAVVIPFALGIHSQVTLDTPYGDNPMSTEGLIVTGSFSVLLMVFIFGVLARVKLKTKVTTKALYFVFTPLQRKWKKIVPDEIDRYEIRTYRAMREFGGYGMKRRLSSGQSYTISGNTGLQLYLKNGKRILIGTQKRQALESAMLKLLGTEFQLSENENAGSPKRGSLVGGRMKKILIVIAIEFLLVLLIFIIIQIFK